MNNKSNIVIIVLALLVIILGSYFIYDQARDDNGGSKLYPYNMVKRQHPIYLSDENFNINVSKKGEVTISLKNTASLLEFSNSSKVDELSTPVCTTTDGSTSCKLKTTELSIEPVVGVYSLYFGNDIDWDYAFIMKDGTISKLDYDHFVKTGEYVIESNVGDLKNIVNIYQTIIEDESSNYAVDSNGNEFLLTEYFK